MTSITFGNVYTSKFKQWNKYNKAYRELLISVFFCDGQKYAHDG